MNYSLTIAPIQFSGKKFHIDWQDTVVCLRLEEYITEHGGILSAQDPDYLVGSNGLTPVQFWIGVGEFDRIQRHERMEEALVFLASGSAFSRQETENMFWYIRENRSDVIAKILAENLTDGLAGLLAHCYETLPGDYTVLKTDAFRDQILLDLTDELISRTDAACKYELKAWLMEYKKNTFPDHFVEEVEQERFEKELGFAEQNEYDWLKLFSFTYEDDGVHIDRYKGSDRFVLIPDFIEGKPVTSVAIRNFWLCDDSWQFAWQRPAHLIPEINRENLAAAQVGDIVEFGLYPLDKYGNTAPMEWQVLKKEGSRILVITKWIIDKSAYHNDFEGADWSRCDLRRWLNGPFYQLAFTPEEQAMIPEVAIPVHPNPKYKTPCGPETNDRVFVLSLQEAGELFPDDPSRLGYTTLYAQSRGYYFGGKINCWWLRSPGADRELAALVGNSGSLGTYGYRCDNGEYAIRPAMWIDYGG